MSRTKTAKSKGNSSSGKSGLVRFRNWLLRITFKLLIGAIAFLGALLLLVYLGLFGPIPSKDELKRVSNHTASEVYSADGVMIGKFFIENRRHIENKDISEHVIHALIATEDSRFFEHKGLDYISMGRVFLHSVLLGDRRQGGGSTISQQLAKNLYPRRPYKFLSLLVNKSREMFTAARLEEVYTKAEILNLYLNTVPFGENIYGIEVAANRFFSKSSADLQPHEAATLVGMLAANTLYNPRLHPEKSKKRRNTVIDRMVAQEFLSKEEGVTYKGLPLGLNYRVLDHDDGPAPYFVEHIRIQAKKILKEQYNDSIHLYEDGLKIFTTLDSRLQRFANEAVNNQMVRLQKEFDHHWRNRNPWEGHPEIYVSAIKKSVRYQSLKEKGLSENEIMQKMEKPVKMVILKNGQEQKVEMSPADSVGWAIQQLQAGFLAVDPVTGHVLAWVGGTNYKFFQYDHVLSKRQVGSTFKPFVYATALEEGYDPCDYISNERRVYKRFNDWSPVNSDGNHDGYYSVQGALVHSVNTVTAELTVDVGAHDVADLARKAGIESDLPDVPSLGLGTAELSLYEMVGAYTAFANYGNGIELQSLLRIEDAKGKVLYEAKPSALRDVAFEERTARFMVHMLQQVVERGTARSLKGLFGIRSQLAGKTGTTQNNADGWFIGFSPGLVAGAWVGADNPGIRFRSMSLGQGAHTALPIFGRFMQKTEQSSFYQGIGRRSFYPLPEGLISKVDCPDYSMEDPDLNFFERLFGGKKQKSDGEDPSKAEDEEKEDKGKSLLERMKDIFRRKEQ
ncbi:penicillin-binding protein 1A [Thermophagus sp. OGC60D27]|uniref:penicillin-binding protein 1A n=1 Tax=Thermophagus sp. OGC60D27 TaxID=3458415 RepID=UPI004037A58E